MEENIKEAMAAAHDNMQEKMQEKVAEVKNTLDSLEGTSRANRFTVSGIRFTMQFCWHVILWR